MLRFLWFHAIDKEFPEIKQYQIRRLVFGLTPSPVILASTIQHHLVKNEEKEPDVTSLLSSSLYVNDFAGGVFHEEETMDLYHSAQRIMKEGGILLRKWNSNSQPFRERIKKDKEMKSQEYKNTSTSEKEITRPVMEHSTQEEQFVKVLGIYWDVVKDEFRYDLSDLIKYVESLPLTNPSWLSAKVFDPMGLITPVTISMKILFQSLCIENVNWDERLEREALTKWNAFICDLIALKNIRVSRCYAYPQTAKSTPYTYQLHGFSDASGRAYAGAVYLRTEFSNGEVQVNLMTSKTRVSPIKRQSIPRLELLGAMLLSQLVYATQEAIQPILKIDETFLWTDSFTVLCWIKNPKLWKPYVQHRVEKIRELPDEVSWNFCPG